MQKISLFVILSVLLTMPMAFGQEEALGAQKITLTSDNTAYQEGDVITITGTIEKVLPGMPATLQIFFEKNLYKYHKLKFHKMESLQIHLQRQDLSGRMKEQ